MNDIVQEILMAVNVLEMSVDSIEGVAICQAICDEDTGGEVAEERGTGHQQQQHHHQDSNGFEPWMVEHCLQSFSDDEANLPKGIYKLSAKKLCGYMGIHILSTVERGNRWILNEFMKHWQQSLHNQFEPDLTYLGGECVMDEDGPAVGDQGIKYIRYFSKDNLPNEPAARFASLFEIKAKWEAHEIRPFLRDLVLDEKKLDVLLLKHARSVKLPGGKVVYNSRIIK